MSGIKIIAKNKRAHFDYFLSDKTEAGLCLQGTEVKSLRDGKVSLAEAFVTIDQKFELWLINMTIPHYSHGNQFNHDPTRKRKLLVHKKEARQLFKTMQMKNLTLIPTALYFKKSRVKLEIALAKGKKLYDKRQVEAKKSAEKKIKQKDYT